MDLQQCTALKTVPKQLNVHWFKMLVAQLDARVFAVETQTQSLLTCWRARMEKLSLVPELLQLTWTLSARKQCVATIAPCWLRVLIGVVNAQSTGIIFVQYTPTTLNHSKGGYHKSVTFAT